MSWHEGYPLSQNLFTSLHLYNMHTPNARQISDLVFRSRNASSGSAGSAGSALVSTVLRAYCLAIGKSIDSVIREVTSEHYYEEEDFSTSTFSREMAMFAVDESHFHGLLSDALETLHQLDLPQNLVAAMTSRLRLRDLLLDAYAPDLSVVEEVRTNAFKAILDLLPELEQTHYLGKPVADAFTERVQRYLASNTPPRPMMKASWEQAMKDIRQMCTDNIEASRIVDCFPNPSPSALMAFAWNFSSRHPPPSTYSRAVMQGLYFKNSMIANIVPHIDILITDLRELVMAGDPLFSADNWEVELPSDPRYQLARKVDDFLTRATDEYLNLYRMALQNRCRIRRTFAQSITILDSLQALAEDFDADIHTITRSASLTKLSRHEPSTFYPFAAWVFHHKLLAMQHVTTLGFELEIYLPNEYSSIYVYLAHLATTHHTHLAYISTVLSTRHRRLSTAKSKPKSLVSPPPQPQRK